MDEIDLDRLKFQLDKNDCDYDYGIEKTIRQLLEIISVQRENSIAVDGKFHDQLGDGYLDSKCHSLLRNSIAASDHIKHLLEKK